MSGQHCLPIRKAVISAKWLGPAARDLRFSFAPMTAFRMGLFDFNNPKTA
jgi:hypothetical protein